LNDIRAVECLFDMFYFDIWHDMSVW